MFWIHFALAGTPPSGTPPVDTEVQKFINLDKYPRIEPVAGDPTLTRFFDTDAGSLDGAVAYLSMRAQLLPYAANWIEAVPFSGVLTEEGSPLTTEEGEVLLLSEEDPPAFVMLNLDHCRFILSLDSGNASRLIGLDGSTVLYDIAYPFADLQDLISNFNGGVDAAGNDL